MTDAMEHTDAAASRESTGVWCFNDTVAVVERKDGCPNSVIVLTDEALYHTGYNGARAIGTEKVPPPETVLRRLVVHHPEFRFAKRLKLTRIPLAAIQQISVIPAKRWIEIEYKGKWCVNRLAFATPELETYAELFESLRQTGAPEAPVEVVKVRLSEMPATPGDGALALCVVFSVMLLGMGALSLTFREVPMRFAPIYFLMQLIGPAGCGLLMVLVAVVGAAAGILHIARRPDKHVVRFPPAT